MAVSLDLVPMWTDKAGHALLWSEGQGEQTRWTHTVCGTLSNRYMAVPERPKRVCRRCREVLANATLNEAPPKTLEATKE